MEVYSEFPAGSWIKVAQVRLFLDGRAVADGAPTILERYEELYGRRVRDYLQTLTLRVNQELKHAYELRPPFKTIESDEYPYRYKGLGDFDLLFASSGRKATVSVESKKGGLTGRLTFNVATTKTKLAEVRYEEMRRH